MVAVLESACPDSDHHDNFTLVCRARKPTVVLPELMVKWLHNDLMHADDVSISDNESVNTLNVSNALVSYAGSYTCVASILIPDSPTVTTNASSIVSVTGELNTCDATQSMHCYMVKIIHNLLKIFMSSNVSPQYSHCCCLLYQLHQCHYQDHCPQYSIH